MSVNKIYLKICLSILKKPLFHLFLGFPIFKDKWKWKELISSRRFQLNQVKLKVVVDACGPQKSVNDDCECPTATSTIPFPSPKLDQTTYFLHNLSQTPRVPKGTHQIIQKEIDYIYAKLERYLLAL